MTGSCGCIPLSADAARVAIADQVAYLEAALAVVPPESAIAAYLSGGIDYAAAWRIALDHHPAAQVAGALAKAAAPLVMADPVADVLAPVVLDLFLVVGGHQHVSEVAP